MTAILPRTVRERILGPREAWPFVGLFALVVAIVAASMIAEGRHRREVRDMVYSDMARLPLPPGPPLDLLRNVTGADPEATDLAAACSTVGMRGYRWSRSGDVACADDRGWLHVVP